MASVLRLKPQKTYWVGFAHRITHEKWLRLGKELGKRKYIARESVPAWPKGHEDSFACERRLQTVVQEDFDRFNEAGLQEVSGWVQESDKGSSFDLTPAYDGLTVAFDEKTGRVYDSQLEDESLKGP
jgi:hypothetical protein